jgi:hypothetical protein
LVFLRPAIYRIQAAFEGMVQRSNSLGPQRCPMSVADEMYVEFSFDDGVGDP